MNALPLDHVGIAVNSIADSVPLFESLTGQHSSDIEKNEQQGVALVFIGQGTGRLELLEPLHTNSPVARFLAKRGPGVHHLAYRVPDLPAALDQLRTQGIKLIDESPRAGAHGHRIAFLHPSSTGGVLIELVED